MTEEKKYIIAVDFDGFLFTEIWPEIGEPIKKNIDLVKNLKAAGHRIILWTCRTDDLLEEAVVWCKCFAELEFDAVNENLPETIQKYGGDSRKITADFYLDDRSTTVEKMQILLDCGMTEEEFIHKHRGSER